MSTKKKRELRRSAPKRRRISTTPYESRDNEDGEGGKDKKKRPRASDSSNGEGGKTKKRKKQK